MDAVAEWTAAQRRVRDFMTAASPDQVEQRVPACPAWTVRDLLSHMIGLGVDIAGGNHPDDHNETWTNGHVEARRGRPVDELLAEWDDAAPTIEQWMRENNSRPLGDLIIHEQDLRGALGVSGAQDTPGLHAIRDRMVGGFQGNLDGRPSITLRGPSWTWSSADDPASADVELEASDFDLTRALLARRSAAQLRSWTKRGDVAPLLDAFCTLGPLPERDLSE